MLAELGEAPAGAKEAAPEAPASSAAPEAAEEGTQDKGKGKKAKKKAKQVLTNERFAIVRRVLLHLIITFNHHSCFLLVSLSQRMVFRRQQKRMRRTWMPSWQNWARRHRLLHFRPLLQKPRMQKHLPKLTPLQRVQMRTPLKLR